MKKFVYSIAYCFCVMSLSGCVSNNNQYYWGEYETLVYKTHIEPGDVPPLVQIEQIQADIQQAEAVNKPVLPGVYAHLGLMYAATGEKSMALASLNKEKELFPESSVFIDGLIERSLNKAD